MQTQLLKQLHCPNCFSALEIDTVYDKTDEELIEAIVKCRCSVFPIVFGILLLRFDQKTKEIVNCLNKRKVRELLSYVLFPLTAEKKKINVLLRRISSRVQLPSWIGTYIEDLSKKEFLKLISTSTLWNLIELCNWGDSGNFFKYRFSTTSYLAGFILANLCCNTSTSKYVLDLCCGIGHFAHILSKTVPEEKIVCTDIDFIQLFLAKKFFANNAQFICLDVNQGLPFSDDTFSFIICVDALHYLSQKETVSYELMRVLTLEGISVIPHVHNSLTKPMFAGSPLTPSKYYELFKRYRVNVLPENAVLDDYYRYSMLDITKQYSLNQLNHAENLALIISNNDSVFQQYCQIGESVFEQMDNLIINPIYQILNNKNRNNELVISIRYPSEIYKQEYSAITQYLPEVYILEKELVDKNINDSYKIVYKEHKKKLARKFILVDVPINFAYRQ